MKKNRINYWICITVMLLIVIGALFLPQFVFALGDKYRLLHTQTDEREHLNISQVNSAYEERMYDRMYYLLTEGIYKANVTAMDYNMQEKDFNVLWEKIRSQEWIKHFTEYTGMAFYGELYEEPLPDLKRCKKYIVYKEDVQDGIALMLWFLELYCPDTGVKMKLLVDSETSSIYFVKLSVDEATVKEKSSMLGISGKYVSQQKYILQILDNSLLHWEFFCDYYGVQMQQVAEFYAKQQEGSEGYSNFVYTVEEESQGTFIFFLPYGESSAEFVFNIIFESEKELDISVGLSNIADLVPEMLQK